MEYYPMIVALYIAGIIGIISLAILLHEKIKYKPEDVGTIVTASIFWILLVIGLVGYGVILLKRRVEYILKTLIGRKL